MVKQRASKQRGTLPGRADDLRDIGALAEYHPVVAVVGGLGVGVSAVLEAVADQWSVPVLRGKPPLEIEPGAWLVLDDADAVELTLLRGFVRNVHEAHAHLLLGAHTATRVPAGVVVRRLGGLSLEAAAVVVGRAGRGVPAAELAEHVRGHPGLLSELTAILAEQPRPVRLEAVETALAERAGARWLSDLGAATRRAASLLVAAGGRLPVDVDVRGFEAQAAVLVNLGLAERADEGIEASEVLLVAALDPPSGRALRGALDALAAYKVRNPAMTRLAQAWLHMRLGDDEAALAALREAHRFARGSLRTEVFARAIDRLARRPLSPLTAAARLASIIYRYGSPQYLAEARPLVQELVGSGALAPPDVHEARTYLAYLSLEEAGPGQALADLMRSGELAAAEGDRYAEAQAVVWQAWVHILAEDPKVAGRVAARAVRLAKKADAPVLLARAYFALSRAELTEGDYNAAARRLEQAVRVARRWGLLDDEVVILDALADLDNRQGRPSEASERLAAADAILARAGNLPRKGDLALTRAEVALRRGHVATAQRILEAPEVEVCTEPWRRDVVRAEVAVAGADYLEALRRLKSGARHPAMGGEWIRRRAAVAISLRREGLEANLSKAELEAEPAAAVLLQAGEDPSERLERLLTVEDPQIERLLMGETLEVLLQQGRYLEAVERGRRLRDRLAAAAAPTALMLHLESISLLAQGELWESACRAARSQRTALGLGHRRAAQFALETLVSAHLAAERSRGLGPVLQRIWRLAQVSGSPMRMARAAILRYAAALRFGHEPDPADLALARRSDDPLASGLAARLVGGGDDAEVHAVATWLHEHVLGTPAPGEAWIRSVPGPAVELRMDLLRREVILPGGRRVSFARRRVLWRVLTYLYEAAGGTLEPEDLYTEAWKLPFNQSRLNSLYVGIRRLRLLVEPDPSVPRIILASASGGYYMDVRRVRLVEPESPSPPVA